jgi:hypothetical protein
LSAPGNALPTATASRVPARTTQSRDHVIVIVAAFRGIRRRFIILARREFLHRLIAVRTYWSAAASLHYEDKACPQAKTKRTSDTADANGVSLAGKRSFFSAGHKEGRYVRCGRLVLWWYGVRRESELCAIWWLDQRHRNATNGLTLKPPWCSPLYSEDYGKHRPYVRLFGWRLLSVKYDR